MVVASRRAGLDGNGRFLNPRSGAWFVLDLAYLGLPVLIGIAGQSFLAGLFTYLFLTVYVTPTIVGRGRGAPDLGTIVVINLLLGWTLVGWVVALAMAYRTPQGWDPSGRPRQGHTPAGGRPPLAGPPEGWYPNPEGPGYRWWDGHRWTNATVYQLPDQR